MTLVSFGLKRGCYLIFFSVSVWVNICFRISHLERDVSQKRLLMEDIRVKLKSAQDNAQSDADVMVSLVLV